METTRKLGHHHSESSRLGTNLPKIHKPVRIDSLPFDVAFKIVNEVLRMRRAELGFDVSKEGCRSGPGHILEGSTPWEYDRRYLAHTIVHIDPMFREVARHMLWTKVLVGDTQTLERLGVAAKQYPWLAALTTRLDIQIPFSLVQPASLDRLVEHMENLRTIVCESRYHLKEHSYSDIVINSLNRFCPRIRNAVFLGNYENAPTGEAILYLLEKQKNLEILHVDDIKRSAFLIDATSNQRRTFPQIPSTLKAGSLRVLSLGDGTGGPWAGYNGVFAEFWAAFSPEALPAMQSVVFHEFSPQCFRFVSRHWKAIRHLTITSCNRYFYATPKIAKSLNILQRAVKVTHLTISLDVPPFSNPSSVSEWQPLPLFHPFLEAITIRPIAAAEQSVSGHEQLEPLLHRIFTGIVAADLPRLGLVSITDKLVRRIDIATSEGFKNLVLAVRHKKGKRIVVKMLDTGYMNKLWWMNQEYDPVGAVIL